MNWVKFYLGQNRKALFGLSKICLSLCLILTTSCGNKASSRSTYPSALGAVSSQNRYAKFRQMSALAQQRRAPSAMSGLQQKMMMLTMESSLKAKQDQEKLATTIAIGGGAAVLGVGVVGAIAAAISSKKAAKAEAAASEKYYDTQLQMAQIDADKQTNIAALYAGYYGSGRGTQPAAPAAVPKPQSAPTPAAAGRSSDSGSGGGGTGGASRGDGGDDSKTDEQIAAKILAEKCKECTMAYVGGNCNCNLAGFAGTESILCSSEALNLRIAAAGGGGGR